NVASDKPLQETQHTFSVTFYDYGIDISGLWRAFSVESQTDERTYEGSATITPVVKTTKFYYQPTITDPVLGSLTFQSAQYGNLTLMEEYDGSTLVRLTDHNLITLDTPTSYVVDREWAVIQRDSQRRLLSLTQSFYDATTTNNNNITPAAIGTAGDLTRLSKYYDLPLQTSAQGLVLHGPDATYEYDSYGNRTKETTYTGPGTRQYTVSNTWIISGPGNGSTARSAITDYDTTFHVFPTQVTNALGQIERADYDYRMGTLIQVTGLNGTTANGYCASLLSTTTIPVTEETTCAIYDVFGRMTDLIKPGDSPAFSTVHATYYDHLPILEPLFRYKVERREVSGQLGVRVVQQFYDGMGGLIQTKAERSDGSANLRNQDAETA